jgi:hypothetical protein
MVKAQVFFFFFFFFFHPNKTPDGALYLFGEGREAAKRCFRKTFIKKKVWMPHSLL